MPRGRVATHGHNRKGKETRTYRAWAHMRGRCINPKNKSYPGYGGRGITVCSRWRKFENFLADMGEAPIGRSLDRKNNDKGYNRLNCRWATRIEQNQNKRTTRNITHNGVTLCLREWGRRLGFSRTTLPGRLRRGWSVDRALSTPFN